MKLSEYIDEYKNTRKISFDVMEVRTGISRATLSRFMSGDYKSPTSDMIAKLRDGFGLTADEILDMILEDQEDV